MVPPGLGILHKIFFIFTLLLLLKADAKLLEISPKVVQIFNEDIRTIPPLTTMMGELRKLILSSEEGMENSLKTKRSLSGGKTWGKRESPRPSRPLRHGKRGDRGWYQDQGRLLGSLFEHPKQFDKS